ncbi:MAG: RdgB/HAM1 family non-canonical purine NTP pyrophosphatase [Actinomycetes bacterium]
MARLVLATRNQGKVVELRAILTEAFADRLPHVDVERDVVGVEELDLPDVVESGVTFAENALLKARFAAHETGLVAIADDSGLAVDVLGGAPGVFSARWSGRHGDDEANLRLLLAQLADVPDEHRGAAFVCAAALVTPEGHEHVEHGRLAGSLERSPRGTGGFGYDPVLTPFGYHRTCAELEPEEKNAISHRGQAFRALVPHVARLLG